MSSTTAALTPAIEQALALLEPARLPETPRVEAGYLDLLGDRDPTGPHPGQRWMESRALPLIYERVWRPAGGRLLISAFGSGMRGEYRTALDMLTLSRGDRVLDVACGPGNFTREFARVADDGLVVGLDASRSMLDQAAREPQRANLAYIRGDACELPFRDGAFDAICCFAALYLIENPMRALDEVVRVLAPGGRVALLSSCNRGPLPVAVTNAVVRSVAGVRIFGRHDLTRALRAHGLSAINARVTGFAQFVSAQREQG